MQYRKISFCLLPAVLLAAFISVAAQSNAGPRPSPSPTPPLREDQERLRVFTEEVRLPIVALDQFGHYDPALVSDDILVLEDGVPQQIRSVHHIPASVLIVMDTGGELSGLGGASKSTNLTRAVAMQLIKQLHDGDFVSVIQFNNQVDLIQEWTADREATLQRLKTKVSSGKRDVFSAAVAAAAQRIKGRPEGSRHVVFITDGVDTGNKNDRAKAIRQLIDARTTVHIISYTEYVRQKNPTKTSDITGGIRPPTDPITTTDPTLAPGQTRNQSVGVSITFDPAMRRQRKTYEADTKKSQQSLAALAEETGGKIFLPKSSAEMTDEATAVARDIGAEYVVTYKPKRPLADAAPGEYRRIQVGSRRVGLSLRSRRGYVVTGAQ